MASTTLPTASRSPTFDLSDVALLVPARNVAGVIEGMLNRIPTAISRRAGALIVRDDASFDSTADVARRWAARHLDLGALVIEDDTARGQAANTINACRDAARGTAHRRDPARRRLRTAERLGMVLRPLLEGRADVIVAPAPRPVTHPNAATRRPLTIRRTWRRDCASTIGTTSSAAIASTAWASTTSNGSLPAPTTPQRCCAWQQLGDSASSNRGCTNARTRAGGGRWSGGSSAPTGCDPSRASSGFDEAVLEGAQLDGSRPATAVRYRWTPPYTSSRTSTAAAIAHRGVPRTPAAASADTPAANKLARLSPWCSGRR